MSTDISTQAKRFKYWNNKAKEILVGRTIKSARYLSMKEAEETGLDESGIIITLDNGTELLPMRDDEGNGVGALHVFYPDGHDILPTMR